MPFLASATGRAHKRARAVLTTKSNDDLRPETQKNKEAEKKTSVIEFCREKGRRREKRRSEEVKKVLQVRR